MLATSKEVFYYTFCALLVSATLRTFRTFGPSSDNYISWHMCAGSKRQRLLHDKRFMVEKYRSTVAVQTGNNRIFQTVQENTGNMARLSGKTARSMKLVCVLCCHVFRHTYQYAHSQVVNPSWRVISTIGGVPNFLRVLGCLAYIIS
jgi:hypothetical protein